MLNDKLFCGRKPRRNAEDNIIRFDYLGSNEAMMSELYELYTNHDTNIKDIKQD